MNDTTRRYEGCDKVLESGKRCEKPVAMTKENRDRGFIRCEGHPVRRIWPGDGDPLELREAMISRLLFAAKLAHPYICYAFDDEESGENSRQADLVLREAIKDLDSGYRG